MAREVRREASEADYLALARSQTIVAKVMVQIEQAFRHPTTMLDGIEKQKRFIATVHLESRECPWCDSVVSYFEAIPETFDYKLGNGCSETRCPHCEKRLQNVVPFIGSWFWAKREEDKDPSRRRRT